METKYDDVSYELQASFSMEFDKTSRKVSLDIPEKGTELESGLVITPFYNPSVRAILP